MFETQVDGKPVRSPDHPAVTTPGAPGRRGGLPDLAAPRAIEGMAASKDGSKLYALLEGPLWNAEAKDCETLDGKDYLRVLEFDVASEKWTGRHWKYVLEANGHAIGDFNMIDATTGLDHRARQRRRHGRQGLPRRPEARRLLPRPREVQARLQGRAERRQCRRAGAQDRLHRPDEDRRSRQQAARKPLNDGVLTFPFFTIENVDVVDATHIVVGNDNNLPFSSSREPEQGRRQRARAAGSRRLPEGEVARIAGFRGHGKGPFLSAGTAGTHRAAIAFHFQAALTHVDLSVDRRGSFA